MHRRAVHGVERDDSQALRWYRLAADQGYEKALYNMGLSYEQGRGSAADNVRAYKWYLLARQRGSGPAATRLMTLWVKMNGDDIAEAERLAAEWRDEYAANW